MASLRSSTFFVELLQEDKQQKEKDEQDGENTCTLFLKA